MIINNNMNAMNAHRNMSFNTTQTGKAMEKLSSGLRINRAGDDAAGLAISEKMRGQIRGLDQATRNSQDGISLIQTAEGALNETHDILQRMRELAVQSSNDTNNDTDRTEIQKEVDQLAQEITRIANNTEFNQQSLLNGGITSEGKGDLKFHIGANNGQNISLSIKAMDASSLGVARDLTTGNLANATKISSIEFDKADVGTSVIDKSNLTISATVEVADRGVVGTTTAISGTTITTAENTDAYNGYTVTINHGGASGSASATIDNTARTISVNVFDDSKTAAAIQGALNTATGGSQVFVATGDNGLTTGNGSAAIGSGAKDTVSIAITNGTTTETVKVQSDATKATFSGAGYKGITVNFSGGDLTTNATPGSATTAASSVAGTISVVQTEAKAAEFVNNELTKGAVADAGINVSKQDKASEAVKTINDAIEKVSSERSKLGAVQNRLEHTINNLSTSAENLQAAESRIRDVDMAKEMMNFTKNNILNQAAQAMMAQSKSQPEAVLQLLR